METHPDPQNALSDGPNMWPINNLKPLLETLQELDQLVKKRGFIENDAS
jgi:2-dehydro-3-deoxyphosphooctonate aldolase (KDO 8-P synthase)